MHDIEPYYHWRDKYTAEADERTPFYGRVYDEFGYSNAIYNYYIHPQWDFFGSQTLYTKILFINYDEGYVIMEMIGEWNDALHNDIMFLKRELIEKLQAHDIRKFILICENVLNFHADEDAYYEEWHEEAQAEGGWICFINTLEHVEEEMAAAQLNYYVIFGGKFSELAWRPHKPQSLFRAIESLIENQQKFIVF